MSELDRIIAAARQRGIPVREVIGSGPVWRLGHGAAGRHFAEAATDRDGYTGLMLAHNKVWANMLIRRLGFPTTVQRLATDADAVVQQARVLGFPVVVKPFAAGMGRGVCADIRDESGLAAAWTAARPYAPHGVLVERHVAGHDHRLTVFGGRLAWAVRRHPAEVIGDGARTVGELIAAENARRTAVGRPAELKPIRVDAEIEQQLRQAGLALDSRPPAGAEIRLRSVANVARGGTIEDCTARVHPDVRSMAEAIARTVRMDSLGIDFITPDIARSWRDVPCAVIEINQTPSLFTAAHVEALVERHFPVGSDGRIPTVLLVEANPALVDLVAGWFAAAGCSTGCTTPRATLLAGAPRCLPGTPLADRVEALVADPACQALVVAMPLAEIERDGLPIDRFDLCLRPATLSAADGLRVAAACREVVEAAADGAIDAATVQAALGRVLQRYTPSSSDPRARSMA